MSWFTNSLSVLFGYQSQKTLENLVIQCSTEDRDKGLWTIHLHDEIQRLKMFPILISWFHSKHFQGIVTGPRTIYFIQYISQRRILLEFKNIDKQKKCLILSITNEGKYIRNSDTAVFATSLFTELTKDLAKQNFLFTQLFNLYPTLVESNGELLYKENLFSNPPERNAYFFVRIHKHKVISECVINELEKSRFKLDKDNSTTNNIVLLHANANVNVIITFGYNKSCFLILSIHFENNNENTNDDKNIGSENHFNGCIHRIGCSLAQKVLLRSQKFKQGDLLVDESDSKNIELIDYKIEDPIPISECLE